MQPNVPKHLEARLAAIKVLVVDDDHYMRKVVRTMLTALGVKHIHDADDGAAGLEAVRKRSPDLVFVDWEMPVIDGLQFIKTVRSPGGGFAVPDVPIVLLTGHGERWRVVEASRLGVQYLLKPVSTKALLDRVTAVLMKPLKAARTDKEAVPVMRSPSIAPSIAPDSPDNILLLTK